MADGGRWAQVQRLGNPLINEVIIGTGSKDRFSMDAPVNDAQFSNFFLNPLLATVIEQHRRPRSARAPHRSASAGSVHGADLPRLHQASQAGPIADLLRLNTGIPPTAPGSRNASDSSRAIRPDFRTAAVSQDDVVDIALRAVGGILVNATKYGTPLGDGVNISSSPLQDDLPVPRRRL